LYAALNSINAPDTKILTAENPVEYNLSGIVQVNINPDINFMFADALRAFLRQDPDIIMVGEIRDKETAQIAMEAAMTGHLVFSTIHTNDAPSAVARLHEMDVPTFMISGTIEGVLAQRLVRRVCKECKEEQKIPVEALIEIGFSAEEAPTVKTYKGKGCEVCNGTGFKGRVGLYEVMEITDELRELIIIGASAIELRRKAIELGMITLRQSGLYKIREGITTIEEVVKETVL
jgi:type IV pilus assembly protein PilB